MLKYICINNKEEYKVAFKLKEIFTGEEEDTEVNDYEIKETTKKSNNKEFKNKTILVEPRAF